MNEEERYLFDLQGYLVLRNVISPEHLEQLNAAVARIEAMEESEYPGNAHLNNPRTPSHLYITDILEFGEVFHPLIDHAEVLPRVAAMIGGPYRLNHAYLISRWGGGFTHFHLGNAPVAPCCQFRFADGRFYCTLVKVVFPLLDCGPEDGCFAVIPGSHKSNVPKPYGGHPDEIPCKVAVPARAGDAIIFTEALTHGSMVNTSGRPRRTLYYAYSVKWMSDWNDGPQVFTFSEELRESVTPRQRELIAPPSHRG
jgi:ectoine hydroxylase-related dioxygenase (phytanoyl-CoA dioxygenase family)